MSLQRTLAVGLLVSIVLLAACGSASSPTAIPTLVLSSNPATSATSVSASGVVVPARKAQLAFPLTGVVRTVSVQVGDAITAGQQLAALDTAILEAQAKVADADLSATQISYTYLARSGTDQEHLDSALSDVARAQAILDSAKATLAQATLLSPFDATVASVDITPGETVIPGQVVLTIGDFTHYRVETTDLSERDAPKVQAGQVAEVDVTALNTTFSGKVTDISRISTTIGGDVVYKVTIEFDSQPSGLLWGMSTNVSISTGQ
jgi:RND family efflux transporter MFP subunit